MRRSYSSDAPERADPYYRLGRSRTVTAPNFPPGNILQIRVNPRNKYCVHNVNCTYPSVVCSFSWTGPANAETEYKRQKVIAIVRFGYSKNSRRFGQELRKDISVVEDHRCQYEFSRTTFLLE